MRKVLAFMMAVMLLVALAGSVFATEFVPSITYKDSIELLPIVKDDGEIIFGVVQDGSSGVLHELDPACLVVTPLADVDTSDEIPADAAESLKATYAFLQETPDFFGSRKVVRELFDVSALCDELKEALAAEGANITLKFAVNLGADETIEVKSEQDGVWTDALSVVNNGDGTVTCTFDHLCPVVFLTDSETQIPAPTGDSGNREMGIYLAAMLVSLVAITALVVVYRRRGVSAN